MSKRVVYQIKNKVNGKIYIGSTNNKKRRWRNHKRQLSDGCHQNSNLQDAWGKYGDDNFEFCVMEVVDEASDLISREQHYIDKLDPEYNIAPRADRTKISQETRQKMKENHADVSGKNNPNYGREFSKEVRERMSEAKRGEENPFYGKEHSKETKERMREIMKGRSFSEEAREKMSKAQRGEKSFRAKLTKKKVKVILHLLEGDSFTQKEIGKMYGVAPGTIANISVGRTWSHVSI